MQDSFPQSRVELCWWLDEASVQFRIAGRGLVADSTTQDPQLQAVRSAVWQRLMLGKFWEKKNRSFSWMFLVSFGLCQAKVASSSSRFSDFFSHFGMWHDVAKPGKVAQKRPSFGRIRADPPVKWKEPLDS